MAGFMSVHSNPIYDFAKKSSAIDKLVSVKVENNNIITIFSREFE